MADQELIIKLQAQIEDVISQFAAVSSAATDMGGNIVQQMQAAAAASSSAWQAAVASINAQGNPIHMFNDVFASTSSETTASLEKVASKTKAVVPPVNLLGQTFKTALGVVGIASVAQLAQRIKQFGIDAVSSFTKADSAAKEFQNTLVERGLSRQEALQASNIVGGIGGNVGLMPEDIQQGITSIATKLREGKDAALGFNVALDAMHVLGGSFATAVQRVAIAAEGSLKALRQFGITTNKDVNGNLKTTNQLLQEMANNMKGGLATYLQTPLGMIDRMKVSIESLKIAIGKGLTDAFAPVAQWTRGFANALTAMIVASSSATPALNQLALSGAQIAKSFYDAAKSFQIFAVSTFIPLDKHEAKVKQDTLDRLHKEKQDADAAANKVIESLTTSTPQSDVADYLKQIDALLKKETADADDTSAAAIKVGSSFQAAFAPLTLLSGNIPQLAKYIGNLSSKFVLRSTIDINLHDGTGTRSSSATGHMSSLDAAKLTLKEAVLDGIHAATPGSHGADAWNTLLGRGRGGSR
jgi:hypothetical protein